MKPFIHVALMSVVGFVTLSCASHGAGSALQTSSSMAPARDATDRGLGAIGEMEVVARFYEHGPSGIAVMPDGRVMVGFPRHAEDHDGPTLGRLDGGAIVPFPDAVTSLPSSRPPLERLVSVHGMTIDAVGRLWVIDDGKRAGRPIEDGAAKVVGFDPRSGAVVSRVAIRPPVLLPDSHLNDLRVDLTHGAMGTAYVTDSSFGTSAALVVVDLATGQQRRVLTRHHSTQPEQGFVAMLEGIPLRYEPKHPSFPVGGADGVTLSADSARLFYAPLTSRRLYSIATDLLARRDVTERELEGAVVDEGEKGFADGLASDADDTIYITDAEHDSILRRTRDGNLDVLARDPRIVWPDGIFATRNHVYVTLGQWNRLPAFNDGRDLRQPPFLLVRIPRGR